MGQLRQFWRLATIAVLLATLALGAMRPQAADAAGQQCFPQTNICAENAFLDFWNAHGDVEILGYPLDQVRQFPDGIIRQFFERAILEWHPENPPEYQVLLTRLGATLIDGDPHTTQPPINCNAECHFFTETKHTLRAEFLNYWSNFGGLAVFGFPLTEPFLEVNQANGQTYLVQYFERNRFELHPENDPRYQVLLGRLGAETLEALGSQVTSLPTVTTPDYDGWPVVSIAPDSAYIGTIFTAHFEGLDAGSTYTVVIYDETHGGAIAEDQKFTAEYDGTLTISIDSSMLQPGNFRIAIIDASDREIGSANFEILFRAGG